MWFSTKHIGGAEMHDALIKEVVTDSELHCMMRPMKNTHRWIIAISIALCVCVSGIAQKPETDDPDAQIKAMLKAHDESELGYVEAYGAFLPKFQKFAREHRGTEAEARATLWMIQQTWWLRKDGKMEETSMLLAEDLLKRHPESEQLDLLVEFSYVFSKEQRDELFNALLEVSPHDGVKAAAHFGLARLIPVRTDAGPNPHLQILLDEYAEVPWRLSTYGAIADAYLNPHPKEALAVGQPAPEIVGIDHKGEPMRLSDFRGRVIMLDFWGHW